MRLDRILWCAAAMGAGALLYGALFETDKLRVERRRLIVPRWPAPLDGYKVAVLADAHVRDHRSVLLTQKAVEYALMEEPDMVVIPGDSIAYWKRDVLELVETAFAGLKMMHGRAVAVAGNHDYAAGDARWLVPVFDRLGVKMLFNDVFRLDGINWVGVDSEIAGTADPYDAILKSDPDDPIVVVWHEPDMVDVLPFGPELMISGHSHGGQFTTPWGWAPATSHLGRKYLRGFYPHAPVPLYVSRGIGTTGPPARLFCTPEVSVLTLHGRPVRQNP
ncbi:MAG: metallophosphoesterase [Armatimonadetes bacterium]|nr:metallophosphoesterase [Armatimonadota bacterium]